MWCPEFDFESLDRELDMQVMESLADNLGVLVSAEEAVFDARLAGFLIQQELVAAETVFDLQLANLHLLQSDTALTMAKIAQAQVAKSLAQFP